MQTTQREEGVHLSVPDSVVGVVSVQRGKQGVRQPWSLKEFQRYDTLDLG